MTKQKFLEITRACFKEYGFKILKNTFILELSELYVIAEVIRSNYSDCFYIDYNYSIKALHSEPFMKGRNYDLVGYPRIVTKEVGMLDERTLDKDIYLKFLNKIIKYYFDPIKQQGLKFIKTEIYSKDFCGVFSELAEEYLKNI